MNRPWHGFKCANDHLWWSAPTSNRCPVCGTTTYTPLSVYVGELVISLQHTGEAPDAPRGKDAIGV